MEDLFRRWERQQDELGRDLAQFINRHPYITAGVIGYFLLSILYIDIMRNW